MREKFKKFFQAIVNIFKKYKFYIIMFLFLIAIEYFNLYNIIQRLNLLKYIKLSRIVLSLFWIVLILFLLYICNNKIRKIFTIVLISFFSIFTIANYFFYRQFDSIISWKDLILSKDGAAFADALLPYINIRIIVIIIVLIAFIIYLIKIVPKDKISLNKIQKRIFLSLFAVISIFYIIMEIKLNTINDECYTPNVLNNESNYYVLWNDSSISFQIGGTYDYILRDFYFSFIKKENKETARKYLNELLQNDKLINQNNSNKYSGILKGKNLIYVMMESLDDWMVSKEVTPTIYKMMNEGLNFTNHYSPVYVTGSTENTEFIANTGIYPKFNGLSPCYVYQNNLYPFSIASVFKDEGYTVNSIHEGDGIIYNRAVMHLSLGYDNYYDNKDMNMTEENRYLDTTLISNGYKFIASSKKFMTSIITFSPHQPYNSTTDDRAIYMNFVKSVLPDATKKGTEYVRALSSAHETDLMFKNLIDKLKNDGILDNTVIVAYTDHCAHIEAKEGSYDTEKDPNQTVFFIWNNKIKHEDIKTITSTINILPTVMNLFGINQKYYYPGYDALNIDSSESYYILKNNTYYNFDGYHSLTDIMKQQINYSKNILISDYYRNIKK